MQNNKSGQICSLVILLIISSIHFSCSNKRSKLARLAARNSNGIIQTKRTRNRMIVMELLSQSKSDQNKTITGKDLYKIKLTLVNNEKMTGKAIMQYFNFDIKNSFYAIKGTDTLPCVICERVPGIKDNEFLYITCFSKPAKGNDNNLRLFIADAIADFDTTAFEIENKLLENQNQ